MGRSTVSHLVSSLHAVSRSRQETTSRGAIARAPLGLDARVEAMAPLVVSPSVSTRWTDDDDDAAGARWFEVEVALPGVRAAGDIVAETVRAGSAPVLSVLAMAETGGEGGDRGTDYRADVPLPPACASDEVGRVKFSKRRSTLTVRFARAKAPAPAPSDPPPDPPSEPDPTSLAEDARDVDDAANDDENPLAEYLSMLGADAEKANVDGCPPLDVDDVPAENPTRPAPAVVTAAIAAASAPTVIAAERRAPPGSTSSPSPSHSSSSAASSASGNRRSTKGKKKARGGRTNANANASDGRSGRLAPLRCIRTARTMRAVSDMADDLASSLNARGWATAEFITSDAVSVVRDEIANVARFYTPGEIWLGKADAGAQISVKSVRGDRIFWMDPDQIEAGRFRVLGEMLAVIDKLVLDELSRRAPRLASLADRTHAMLAEYPGRGSRFVRHVDNTGRDGRRLTVLCYLNPDYVGEHGGALKVYPADDVDGARGEAVAPAGGKIAMFYADQIPHEVLPSHRERHSFTVWYYDEAEHREATARQGDVAAADSRAAHVPVADLGESDERIRQQDLADARASAFVKTMMTENLTAEKATAAARALGPSALKTAATVFGAPDETAFVASLERMSPEDFSQLRAEMASMGMENAPDAEWAE